MPRHSGWFVLTGAKTLNAHLSTEVNPLYPIQSALPQPLFKVKTEVEIGYMAGLMKDGYLGSNWVHGLG